MIKQNGVGVLKWGYFSDVALGPFITFGIDTEAKEMLKTENDRHTKASQDIAAFNIQSYIYEMRHHAKYTPTEDAKITTIGIFYKVYLHR